MKSAHKLGAALVAALLLGTFVQSGGAEAGAKIPSTVPSLGLILEENFDIAAMPDVAITMNDDADTSKSLICSSLDDKLCDEATRVMIIQHLPSCVEDPTTACISEVWAIDGSGKKIIGNYSSSIPNNSIYDRGPVESMGLPAVRGIGALFNLPGVTNSGGEDNYFVSVKNNVWIDKASGTSLRTKQVDYVNISAAITPVQKLTGDYRANKATDKRDGGVAWGSYGLSSTPSKERCAVTDNGICQVTRDFPSGYRFGLTLRLGSKLSGWFHGRIALPNISSKPWKDGVELSVEAEPVNISTLNFSVPNSQIPDAVRKIIFVDKEFGVSGTADGGVQTMGTLSHPDSMEIMNAFLPAIGDKATKTTGYWSYSALNSWNQPAIQKCSDRKGDLAGVVTTNALTYSAGPPSYNKETGSLEYKVASPHFEASGAIATGTYDLVLKSDVARCIYGFSKAPIQAEISITSSDGEKKIATTVVNEKDGWLYLSAKGFTFSSPIINVKLSQEKEVVVIPDPTPTPTPTPSASVKPIAKKSLTIRCVKGKVSKKVSGTNPKCPAGYKKK
jgi:hypothetical protein